MCVHQPIRSCISCRTRRPQDELLRLTKTIQGWAPDPQRRAHGRGFYICPDRPQCLEPKKLRRLMRDQAAIFATKLTAWLNPVGGTDA